MYPSSRETYKQYFQYKFLVIQGRGENLVTKADKKLQAKIAYIDNYITVSTYLESDQ